MRTELDTLREQHQRTCVEYEWRLSDAQAKAELGLEDARVQWEAQLRPTIEQELRPIVEFELRPTIEDEVRATLESEFAEKLQQQQVASSESLEQVVAHVRVEYESQLGALRNECDEAKQRVKELELQHEVCCFHEFSLSLCTIFSEFIQRLLIVRFRILSTFSSSLPGYRISVAH